MSVAGFTVERANPSIRSGAHLRYVRTQEFLITINSNEAAAGNVDAKVARFDALLERISNNMKKYIVFKPRDNRFPEILDDWESAQVQRANSVFAVEVGSKLNRIHGHMNVQLVHQGYCLIDIPQLNEDLRDWGNYGHKLHLDVKYVSHAAKEYVHKGYKR